MTMRSIKGTRWLLSLLALVIVGCWFLSYTASFSPVPEHDIMLAASQRTAQAYEAVRTQRLSLLPVDAEDDPNATGLIGPMFTGITTTQGQLEAKRTTTNPNSGALLVHLLLEAGVSPGDTIAVNLSGSFPAVNIALFCAMEELDVTGIVFSSVGASTYGATLPELTYPDMELLLWKQGIITQRSAYISMGGQHDLGSDMDPSLVSSIQARLSHAGYSILTFEDLRENLDFRFQYYNAAPISCFVNIGGNLLSFGGSSLMTRLDGGILTHLPTGETGDGLVQRFLRQGTPVINLLGMKDIYSSSGLPIDPVPLPLRGEGDLYEKVTYNRPAAALFLVVAIVLLWKLWLANHPRNHY